MRQKAFYNVNEITTNLYTSGKEWMLTDGTEYIGLYHTYITEEVYTQPVWDKNKSKKLISYEDINTSKYKYKQLTELEVPNKSFNSITPILTKQDIQNKYKVRYIVKKNNNSKFFETDKQSYELWEKQEIDNVLYTMTTIKWIISGNVQEEYNGNILIPSVQQQNKQTLIQAEKTISGVSNYLTNLLELYIQDDIIISTDINGLDS